VEVEVPVPVCVPVEDGVILAVSEGVFVSVPETVEVIV
jgi:hypothetical protein